MKYAALAEGPGAFIQAFINYRMKLGPGLDKTKIFGITIHSEKGKFIEMGKQFLGFYEKKEPGLINIHETFPIKESKLTIASSINAFVSSVGFPVVAISNK